MLHDRRVLPVVVLQNEIVQHLVSPTVLASFFIAAYLSPPRTRVKPSGTYDNNQSRLVLSVWGNNWRDTRVTRSKNVDFGKTEMAWVEVIMFMTAAVKCQ